MGPTLLEVLELKVQRGDTLTLDERVYWHEAKAMGAGYRVTEPPIQTADQTLSFLARHGIQRTRQELVEWLDLNNVPK